MNKYMKNILKFYIKHYVCDLYIYCALFIVPFLLLFFHILLPYFSVSLFSLKSASWDLLFPRYKWQKKKLNIQHTHMETYNKGRGGEHQIAKISTHIWGGSTYILSQTD